MRRKGKTASQIFKKLVYKSMTLEPEQIKFLYVTLLYIKKTKQFSLGKTYGNNKPGS
jgi:hypothetical protein